MLIDSREIPTDRQLEADICIVGAGAAGICIAREFVGTGVKVIVLESGGLGFDTNTQVLFDGPSDGLTYFPLISTRLRFFGGTTNHWGGNCHPFSSASFTGRPWIDQSSWPISPSEIAPYYTQAEELLKLPEQRWNVDYWSQRGPGTIPGLGSNYLVPSVVHLVRGRDRRFGSLFRDQLSKAKNVDVLLWANLTQFKVTEAADHVRKADVRCLSGKQFQVSAHQFVLAAGGIENARLLLLSNQTAKDGLGNKRDQVGRYFMDHPRFETGIIAPSPNLRFKHIRALNGMGRSNSRVFQVQYNLSDRVQEDYKVAQAAVYSYPEPTDDYENSSRSMATKSINRIWKDLKSRRIPDHMNGHISNIYENFDEVSKQLYYGLRWPGDEFPIRKINCGVRFEPIPNPESRVTLDDSIDNLGQRRAKLTWRLSDQDRTTVKVAMQALAFELGSVGLGRIRTFVEDPSWEWPISMEGGHHQIGTTRMSEDPRGGVVDKDCKVHGIDNLYIAGSSVFTTAGRGWPTLTLLALSYRLTTHLRQVMKSGNR